MDFKTLYTIRTLIHFYIIFSDFCLQAVDIFVKDLPIFTYNVLMVVRGLRGQDSIFHSPSTVRVN